MMQKKTGMAWELVLLMFTLTAIVMGESSNIVETRVLPPPSFLQAMKRSGVEDGQGEAEHHDLESEGSEHLEKTLKSGSVKTSVTKSVQVVIGPAIRTVITENNSKYNNHVDDLRRHGDSKEARGDEAVAKVASQPQALVSSFNSMKKRVRRPRLTSTTRSSRRTTTTTTTRTTKTTPSTTTTKIKTTARVITATEVDDLVSDWMPIHMPLSYNHLTETPNPHRRSDSTTEAALTSTRIVEKPNEISKFTELRVGDPYEEKTETSKSKDVDRRKRFEVDFTDTLHPDQLSAPKTFESSRLKKEKFEHVVQNTLDQYKGPITNHLKSRPIVSTLRSRPVKPGLKVKSLPIIKPSVNTVTKRPSVNRDQSIIVRQLRNPRRKTTPTPVLRPPVNVKHVQSQSVVEKDDGDKEDYNDSKDYVSITRPIVQPRLLGDSFWQGHHRDRSEKQLDNSFFSMIHDSDFSAQPFAQLTSPSVRGVPLHIIRHMSKEQNRRPRWIQGQLQVLVQADNHKGSFTWQTHHPVGNEQQSTQPHWLWH